IILIDFALAAERGEGLAPREAIHRACLLRFRPILMTTMAAMLGAVPLALGAGDGAELRRPLGIAIVGGLAVSQLLTLYTTPVVYLVLDRLRLRVRRGGGAGRAGSGGRDANGARETLARSLQLLAVFGAVLLLVGCTAAPEYVRPPIAIPAEYKEVQPTGVWQPAQPDAPTAKVSWEVCDDPVLESLIADADVSNQNLRLAEARLRSARAAVVAARAERYPFVSAGASASRGRTAAGITNEVYGADVAATWEIDLWGRVRAGV